MLADASTAPSLPESARDLSIVCMVCTYNEAENILLLAEELLALGPQMKVLVVDDDSPDGTWQMVRDAGVDEPRLLLMHRTTDRGRGTAGREGYARALELGADIVIEMDADFSHPPRYIPAMVERLLTPLADMPLADIKGGKEIGLVLGSRGVRGGSDEDRGFLRRFITTLANAYIRLVLWVSIKDCNSGFRCWRHSALETIGVDRLEGTGPNIIQETLFKTGRAGIPIAEVPIAFVDRVRGESTLTVGILLRGWGTVLRLRWLAIAGRI